VRESQRVRLRNSLHHESADRARARRPDQNFGERPGADQLANVGFLERPRLQKPVRPLTERAKWTSAALGRREGIERIRPSYERNVDWFDSYFRQLGYRLGDATGVGKGANDRAAGQTDHSHRLLLPGTLDRQTRS